MNLVLFVGFVFETDERLYSRTSVSVPVKLGLFNAKIHNESGRCIHKLIYQLNEQDLLCHSI